MSEIRRACAGTAANYFKSFVDVKGQYAGAQALQLVDVVKQVTVPTC